MAPLGPFGTAPRLAAAVSGGPHSLALALLAAEWAERRGGSLLALIVDHGLRPESAVEAQSVAALLQARRIAARVLRLAPLSAGSALQARAREARLQALLAACREEGCPWLLLGHHQADQAETLLHRAAAGSGPAGLSAMAATRATPEALVLRPLLGVAPARLEGVLHEAGLQPVRDPSNADRRFARTRLRQALDDPHGTGAEVAALAAAASAFGRRRAALDAAVAARLGAGAARLFPEGWATVDLSLMGKDAIALALLAALIRVIGGAHHFAPPEAAVAALLARRAGTLGGAWLRCAGDRLVLLREPEGASGAAPVTARPGAVWDHRFRMTGEGAADHMIGALGATEATRLRRSAGLSKHVGPVPAGVLATLPAIRIASALGEAVAVTAVPALGFPDPLLCARFAMALAPTAGPVIGRG
jgi:tRNA(Ile)-lysidine synthase